MSGQRWLGMVVMAAGLGMGGAVGLVCPDAQAADAKAAPPPAAPSSAAPLKVGYVKLTDVFDNYQRTKNSEAVLEKKGKQKESELQGRMNELAKLRQSLELLNEGAREAKTREIEARTDELQRFRRDTARELQRERGAVAKEILDDIERAVTDVAKANGYSLVLDERSLLYGQPADNLTEQVLKVLNTRFTQQPKP